MEGIRLAVIGGSFLVHDMLMECLKPLPVQRVGISAPEEEMEKVARHYACGARYADYRALLERERPQVVLLFPREGDSGKIARECLAAGAYVFAERPVCRTTAQAEALIALQRRTGCYLMPRYNRRCAPSYQMAREILGRPEFGRPDLFLANYHAFPFESEEAMLWIHLSHIIDTMIYLLGDLRLLRADLAVRGGQGLGYHLTLAAENGAVGAVQSGFTQCFETPVERVCITGDGRSVEIDNIRSLTYYRPAPPRKQGDDPVLRDGGDALAWRQNFSQMSLYSYYGFEGCLEEIVRAAAERRAPAFHMEDAAKTIRLLEEIEKKVVHHG